MINISVGYKPVMEGLATVLDLPGKYIALNNVYHEIVTAKDEVYNEWLTQYFHVTYEKDADKMWSPEDRVFVTNLLLSHEVYEVYMKC